MVNLPKGPQWQEPKVVCGIMARKPRQNNRVQKSVQIREIGEIRVREAFQSFAAAGSA